MIESSSPDQQSPAAPQTAKQTPLYPQHQLQSGHLVDFGGWRLPAHYGSQITEHLAVRKACGIFDVSHMTVIDIDGDGSDALLQRLLANDIGKTHNKNGKAIYSCMLNHDGGVIDDLIAYRTGSASYRLVTNASTRDKDIAWINTVNQSFEANIRERTELALIAVQGPQSLALCQQVLSKPQAQVCASLSRFEGGFADQVFIGRTGYTGEDGVEVIAAEEQIIALWDAFVTAGATPCGLGARDTLRLEAGMSLYGNELDEHHSPLDSGLAWTVASGDDRDFIGKSALERNPQTHWMVGLELIDKGVLRGQQILWHADQAIGAITSGTFSPTLGKSIALARVNQPLKVGDRMTVAARKKNLQAQVVKTPFYPI